MNTLQFLDPCGLNDRPKRFVRASLHAVAIPECVDVEQSC